VYSLGIEVRAGQGLYKDTTTVILTAQYQLDNRSRYTLTIAQACDVDVSDVWAGLCTHSITNAEHPSDGGRVIALLLCLALAARRSGSIVVCTTFGFAALVVSLSYRRHIDVYIEHTVLAAQCVAFNQIHDCTDLAMARRISCALK
jgi:hypothetical protein